MHKFKYLTISIILLLLFSVVGPSFDVAAAPLAAATSPILNNLLNVSVLAGSSITNIPTTTTSGDRDVSPGPAIDPGGWAGTGTSHFVDITAFNAQAEALTTWGTLNQPCDFNFPVGADLSTTSILGGIAGQLPPGVYCSGTGFSVSTTINLTGTDPYIFKTVSTFVAAVGATVTGGDPCNVWWRIGSSTTLNGGSSFIGTFISQNGANAMGNLATLNGRFLGLSAAAVTLSQNNITGPVCFVPGGSGGSGGGSGSGSEEEETVKKPFSVSGLPNTGGAPIREEFPWSMVIVAGLSAIALGLGVRAYRRAHLPKQ